MSDYDIHSCGYYCDRHACIVAQRNELRDKLFSDQAVKTYSGGKPNYTQPEETFEGWHLYSGLPQHQWVSLTNEEINQIYTCAMSDMDFILDTQAKLKEKNA